MGNLIDRCVCKDVRYYYRQISGLTNYYGRNGLRFEKQCADITSRLLEITSRIPPFQIESPYLHFYFTHDIVKFVFISLDSKSGVYDFSLSFGKVQLTHLKFRYVD